MLPHISISTRTMSLKSNARWPLQGSRTRAGIMQTTITAKKHYDHHLANFYARMIGGFTQKQLEQQKCSGTELHGEDTEVHREMHLYFLRATPCLLCALRVIGFYSLTHCTTSLAGFLLLSGIPGLGIPTCIYPSTQSSFPIPKSSFASSKKVMPPVLR